jgi:hypothetical protein
MQEGGVEIASQAERLREGGAALGELWQRADTLVGIDMFLDAAVDVLAAFRTPDSGLLDVQAEVDTLAAESAEEDGQEAERSRDGTLGFPPDDPASSSQRGGPPSGADAGGV